MRREATSNNPENGQKGKVTQETLKLLIGLERKNSPDKVTDKEVDLMCARKFPEENVIVDDIFQCLSRQASAEQLARLMERYAPISDDSGNLWSAFYANLTKEDNAADKIIKAIELWGKKDIYSRYEKVVDFYCKTISVDKLSVINEQYYAKGERSSWLDRPEQAVLMVKSADSILKEGAKDEVRFNGYEFDDCMRGTDKLLSAVYYSHVSTSPSLAEAVEGLLQTQNKAKVVHLERNIKESMEVFRKKFPDYMPDQKSKNISKGGNSR